MKLGRFVVGLTVLTLGFAAPGPAAAHPPTPHELTPDGASQSDSVDQHGPLTGHLPATSSNVELVGKLRVHDAAEGTISDVAELRNYAYLGQYSPGCAADGAGGAYVVDISDPAHPTEVGFIPAHAGSSEPGCPPAAATPTYIGGSLANDNAARLRIRRRLGGQELPHMRPR